MVNFQWTGAEPPGLSNIEFALAIGAEWEGDELVVHNMEYFLHSWDHHKDGWMEDSD